MSRLSQDEKKLRADINRAIDTLVVHGLIRRIRKSATESRPMYLELTGFGVDWPVIDKNMIDDPIPGLGLMSSPDPLCPKCHRHRTAGCKC